MARGADKRGSGITVSVRLGLELYIGLVAVLISGQYLGLGLGCRNINILTRVITRGQIVGEV